MALRVTALERQIYSSGAAYWANRLLFPAKMLIPQPLVARVPGLTTNEEIRVALVLSQVRGRLLDIGCGTNRLVARYRQRGGEGTGVDVHPWPGADLVVENTARLPFEAGSFDTVTFVACLNHIPNRAEVLREAHRLLREGGRLVVTNLRPWFSRVWHAWAFWDADQHERGMAEGEVYGFRPRQVEALLSEAGFGLRLRERFSWGLNELYLAERT